MATLPNDNPPLREFESMVLVESHGGWPIGTCGAICHMLSDADCLFEIFYADGTIAAVEAFPLKTLRRYDREADGPVPRCSDDLVEEHPLAGKRHRTHSAHRRWVRPVWWSPNQTYVFVEVLSDFGEIEDWWCLSSDDLVEEKDDDE